MDGPAVALLRDWVERTASPEGVAWFVERLETLQSDFDEPALVRAIGLASRRLGRADLRLTEQDRGEAARLRPGLDPQGWSVDQAARIAFLLAMGAQDEAGFADRLTRVARTADLNETIALYRGLPLYPAPERLVGFASEGVRSGVAPIFEAVAHRNPYPAEMFDEPAWNQLVLKALFMERPLWPIQGLDRRANRRLAETLVDFAHERWSAGRPVSPELWRCVGPFADDGRSLGALERALRTGDEEGRDAAAQALRASPDPRAKAILALRSATAS